MIFADILALIIVAFLASKTKFFRGTIKTKYWIFFVLMLFILKPLLYKNFEKNYVYLPRCYNDFRDNPFSCTRYIAGNYKDLKLEDIIRIEERGLTLFYPLWFVLNSVSSIYHELGEDDSDFQYQVFFDGRLYQILYKYNEYHAMSYLSALAHSNRYDLFIETSLYAKRKWFSDKKYVCKESHLPFLEVRPNIHDSQNKEIREEFNKLYVLYSKDPLREGCSRFFQLTFAALANVSMTSTIVSFFEDELFSSLPMERKIAFLQILDSSMEPNITNMYNNKNLIKELQVTREKLCLLLKLPYCS